MSAKLNHTIVWCRDQEKSARFLTEKFWACHLHAASSASWSWTSLELITRPYGDPESL